MIASDSYLKLAEEVLRRIKRPLTAPQILRTAYEMNLAPSHLRGGTQQKTLGARLSEDILRFREASRFYRTAPGRFLLKELQYDTSIPTALRRPIVARRRKRVLTQSHVLALDMRLANNPDLRNAVIPSHEILDILKVHDFRYLSDLRHQSCSDVLIWSFAVVVRDNHILSYRQGSYREDRDSFHQRRTIGFYSPIVDIDLNLFEQANHGIVSSGVRSLIYDLSLYEHRLARAVFDNSDLQAFLHIADGQTSPNLLAIVKFSCPDWLDPTTTRLAINDLEWMDLGCPPNHREDFDPWSWAVLEEARRLAL